MSPTRIPNATISARELSGVLGVCSARVHRAIAAGHLRCWRLYRTCPPRIGAREARRIVQEHLAEDGQARALQNLDSVRRGELCLAPGRGEPPRFGVSAEAHARQSDGAVSGGFSGGRSPDVGDEVASVLRAAQLARGQRPLSVAWYNAWAAVNAPGLTAAVVCGGRAWTNVLTGLGLRANRPRSILGIANEELRQLLARAAAAQPDGQLSFLRFDRWCDEQGLAASAGLVADRFGGWNRGLHAAGLPGRRQGERLKPVPPTDSGTD